MIRNFILFLSFFLVVGCQKNTDDATKKSKKTYKKIKEKEVVYKLPSHVGLNHFQHAQGVHIHKSKINNK